MGRVLGLRDQDMPPTVEAFWPYYRRMLAEELEETEVVRDLAVRLLAPRLPERARYLPQAYEARRRHR